ncbi:MAG TPA: alpha/beta hydrolase [Gemmatimonadales bacterium]
MLRFALILVAAVLVAIVALVWLYQERVVWQPPGPPHDHDVAGAGVRRVEYVAEDGQPLFGWLVEPSREVGDSAGTVPRRVVIAFHGNAEVAAWVVPWGAEVARRTGWTVLIPEYRGYAGLPGRPTYDGSRLDARAAHAWVRDELGVPPRRIALHGFSLGSAVAMELAEEVGPRVVMLQSPFTSTSEMARAFGAWPVAFIWRGVGRVHFDTRRRVARLTAPVWVAHGDRDRVIPTRMGRAVHAAARNPGELLIVPHAGHNDLVERGGEGYWGWVERGLR